MSLEDWKSTFENLHHRFSTRFFLVLGNEPLMMGDDLVELVRWFKHHNLFYGFYSTSPEPLFSRYRQALVDAGLNNWACGIDTIPFSGLTDPITEAKAKDGLKGLIWMADHGVQTFAVVTVRNDNLAIVPKILWTLHKEVPRIMTCINPVEWRHDDRFDFFADKERIKDLIIPHNRLDEVRAMVESVLVLTRECGMQIQNPDTHLLEFADYYEHLDYKCNGITGPAIDCDGSLRLCGYCKGDRCPKWNIKDINSEDAVIGFYMDWRWDATRCAGCHWSYVHALQESFGTLIPGSHYFQDRHNIPIPKLPLPKREVSQ